MRPLRSALLVTCLALSGLTPGLRPAASDEDYRATDHKRFDDVQKWTAIFDDPKRDEWQKPAEVVRALGLRPGMSVADLGAGTGYFSAHLSRAVGPDGTVFAVEVEPRLVEHLRDRAEKESSANVVPVLGSFENPRLPAGAVDLVLIADTFHHLDHRLGYLRRLRRVLAPGGRIAIIDWKKEDQPVGPERNHKIAREQVIREMETAGYRLTEAPDVLPYQYFLVFEPAGDGQT